MSHIASHSEPSCSESSYSPTPAQHPSRHYSLPGDSTRSVTTHDAVVKVSGCCDPAADRRNSSSINSTPAFTRDPLLQLRRMGAVIDELVRHYEQAQPRRADDYAALQRHCANLQDFWRLFNLAAHSRAARGLPPQNRAQVLQRDLLEGARRIAIGLSALEARCRAFHNRVAVAGRPHAPWLDPLPPDVRIVMQAFELCMMHYRNYRNSEI